MKSNRLLVAVPFVLFSPLLSHYAAAQTPAQMTAQAQSMTAVAVQLKKCMSLMPGSPDSRTCLAAVQTQAAASEAAQKAKAVAAQTQAAASEAAQKAKVAAGPPPPPQSAGPVKPPIITPKGTPVATTPATPKATAEGAPPKAVMPKTTAENTPPQPAAPGSVGQALSQMTPAQQAAYNASFADLLIQHAAITQPLAPSAPAKGVVKAPVAPPAPALPTAKLAAQMDPAILLANLNAAKAQAHSSLTQAIVKLQENNEAIAGLNNVSATLGKIGISTKTGASTDPIARMKALAAYEQAAAAAKIPVAKTPIDMEAQAKQLQAMIQTWSQTIQQQTQVVQDNATNYDQTMNQVINAMQQMNNTVTKAKLSG